MTIMEPFTLFLYFVAILLTGSIGVNSGEAPGKNDGVRVNHGREYAKVLIKEKPLAVQQNFYSFIATDIRGKLTRLDKYKGMVSLVVNVASQCGFTDSHYKALVSVQKSLGKNGKFTVLAFPCNQFGAQEPKSNAEIEKFAKEKYGVNFPMFAKINVLDEGVPFSWLFLRSETKVDPSWNFFKYLVGPSGNVIKAWGPWDSVEHIYKEVKKVVDATGAGSARDEL